MNSDTIILLLQFFGFIVSALMLWVTYKTNGKVTAVQVHINSRLDQLLTAKVGEALAHGKAAGRTEAHAEIIANGEVATAAAALIVNTAKNVATALQNTKENS